jgi:phage FluMu protein gp41
MEEVGNLNSPISIKEVESLDNNLTKIKNSLDNLRNSPKSFSETRRGIFPNSFYEVNSMLI